RGGPPGVGSASTLLARTRRGPPARGGVSGVRSPPAAAACVSDSGYQNVIVVLLVARPHLARASAVRTEARPCVLTAGRADGWAGRVWPGERGRRESGRRLHEDGRATHEGDPAVGKLRRGRAAITCGAVRTRRERSVEVQEGLQDLRGVLVDLVGAVLAGTDLVLQAGHGVLTDHAVLLGVGPGLEREGGLLVHLAGLLDAQPVLEGGDGLRAHLPVDVE